MSHRVLFFPLLLAACAPPNHEVSLAEIAPEIVLDVEVGPNNATIALDPTNPKGNDPSNCPSVHDVSVTFDGIPADPNESWPGGNVESLQARGGPVADCTPPVFVVPFGSRSFDPTERTQIRLTDGATTFAIDARDVFATPVLTVATQDGMLHPGEPATIIVSPDFDVTSYEAVLSNPELDVDVPGTVSGDTLTIQIPADAMAGEAQLDLELFLTAPLDRCSGPTACNVKLSLDLMQTIDVKVAPPRR